MTEAIELGRVSRPHGLRGEIEVRLHWPESTALLEAEHVLLTAPGTAGEQRVCRVRYARATPKGVLLCLDDVADRDAAEALKGWTVSLERSVMPPLEPGEYYLRDTLGAEVLGPDGARIGKVVDLRLYPSVDALLIERDGGAQAEQPLADPFVAEVNVAEKKIVLATLDGLIEANESGAASAAGDDGAAAKPRSKKPSRRKRTV